jgi:ABC-type Zn uptake system ZnuABC Zn-binding protein ZnuA
MSKYLFFSFIFLFEMSFAQTEKVKVLATTSMWADMARVIGSDFVEVETIVPIGSDPHLYEPTPSDVQKIIRADVILINGLTFENWLVKLISNVSQKDKSILLTRNVTPISSLDHKGATDPHAWMDVENGILYITEIYKALIKFDPMHEREYEFNFKSYKKQLEELHQYIISSVAKIPIEKRILITSHDAFQYYGKKYGLHLYSLLGISTDADVQSNDLIEINRIIKEKKVPAVFVESTINPKIMQGIQSENKIKIGGKLFADSLGDEHSEGSTYINMIKHNTDVIVSALSTNELFNSDSSNATNSKWIIPFLIIFYIISIISLFLINKK